jgi:hypothetical protein
MIEGRRENSRAEALRRRGVVASFLLLPSANEYPLGSPPYESFAPNPLQVVTSPRRGLSQFVQPAMAGIATVADEVNLI